MWRLPGGEWPVRTGTIRSRDASRATSLSSRTVSETAGHRRRVRAVCRMRAEQPALYLVRYLPRVIRDIFRHEDGTGTVRNGAGIDPAKGQLLSAGSGADPAGAWSHRVQTFVYPSVA